MKTSFTTQQRSLTVACALALSFASGAASAQNFGPASERELWTDTPGRQIWKNGYGECWHSAFGPPPLPNECNPAPIAQYVAPPAPAPYVAPAPTKAQAQVEPAPAPVVVPIERPRKKDRN